MHNLDEIRSRYGPLVWKTIYRILHDYSESLDCYQDVLCETLECLGQREVRNWPAYLRWLATRRAIDRLRQNNRAKARFEQADVTAVPGNIPEPGASAQFNELTELLRFELTKLPARQAEAFWLRCIEEMSYEEISRELGIDSSTVGVLVHRARSHLRVALADFRSGKH